ncbi:MAG: hypothetical protein JJU32_09185 [Phormidium sp. BM_Day4_Bin.17]|nr:hypothetical protein [Phormidium sp. BM_Day4_Bin.17]UCJ11631.1 MAG: hypothetical protein JWS08_18060 [Phormidium sp. PBR-2020]
MGVANRRWVASLTPLTALGRTQVSTLRTGSDRHPQGRRTHDGVWERLTSGLGDRLGLR